MNKEAKKIGFVCKKDFIKGLLEHNILYDKYGNKYVYEPDNPYHTFYVIDYKTNKTLPLAIFTKWRQDYYIKNPIKEWELYNDGHTIIAIDTYSREKIADVAIITKANIVRIGNVEYSLSKNDYDPHEHGHLFEPLTGKIIINS